MIYEDKVELRDPMTPPQKESRKTRTHVFPRRTKKENKYRLCTVCGPFYLPSSPRVEIIVKRSLLSIVILCISLVFSGFDGVPKFFLSANARFVNIDFHTALLFYELLSKIDAYAITYAKPFLHKINSQ